MPISTGTVVFMKIEIAYTMAGAAELGMPGVHVHPLFYGEKGTKFSPNFFQFSWFFSNVHPLILAPCAVPEWKTAIVRTFLDRVYSCEYVSPFLNDFFFKNGRL